MSRKLFFKSVVVAICSFIATSTNAQNVFTVTNTSDSGPGSLRQAIVDSEATPNSPATTPDEIQFAIPGAGVHTIQALNYMPPMFNSVVIDGSTQPGYTGLPLIEIDGSLIPPGSGVIFNFLGAESAIRGLAVNRSPHTGIRLGGNCVAEGCFIGTDPSGTVAFGNSGEGGIWVTGSNNRIGTDGDGVNDIGERNIISGNGNGIRIGNNVSGNVVAGNYIGTDVTGMVALSNQHGVILAFNNSNNIIGTNGDGQGDAVEGNLISGNARTNISILQSNDNVVAGNLVGTDATGLAALPFIPFPGNGFGIELNNILGSGVTTQNNRIGTNNDGISDALEANVVGGAHLDGILLKDNADLNLVSGNFIGVASDGVTPISNSRHGVLAFSGSESNTISHNTISANDQEGVSVGAGSNTILDNTIFANGQSGVGIYGTATGTTISENSIFSNGFLGIAFLGSQVPAPNDDGDPDTGANNFQNYPILTVVEGGGSTRVVGVLNSAPLQAFEIEFFASSSVDPSGHGEGERFLGDANVTTDALNQASFDVIVSGGSASGEWITATATDANGNTSEFSAALQITNTDPIANAGPDQAVQCDSNGQALVMLDGSVSFDPDGDPLEFQWSVPLGIVLDDDASAMPSGLFPLGITLVTLTVTDGKGGVGVDDVEIEVIDTVPPEVACTTDVLALWPPNHQMDDVEVFVQATDNCTDPTNLILLSVTVSSSEPDDSNGTGDGETTGDVQDLDGFTAPVDVTSQFAYNAATDSFEGTISLRAEREGTGSGRNYTIMATILDNSNNLAETSCVVIVPHDRRGGN